jgi:biopolymer transport protein ExbB
MSSLKRNFIGWLFAISAGISLAVHAEEAAQNLDQLLKQVEAGRYKEAAENREREKYFLEHKNEQQALLAAMKAEQARLEATSSRLEQEFDANDKKLAETEARLKQELGSLSELFGHITSVAGDARSNLESSLVSIHHPDRKAFLDELIAVTSSGTDLPRIEQIDRLAFELQREMTGQGQVVKFRTPVSSVDGNAAERSVVRIGVFNVVDEDGTYLQLESGHLKELPRQPARRYTASAADLAGATAGVVKVGLDPTGPTGGSLLSALINSPSLGERFEQGGLVGYVITAIGVLVFAIAVWRLTFLFGVRKKVEAELKSSTPSDNNPLGRVLLAAKGHAGADLETFELKLNEAILKELPSLKTGETWLKIFAALAPLLGLLGTVTGMIVTFQAITIYGAGDPKAMAGGISTALVTTVQGLMVAIPAVLLHALVSGQSKRIVQVLEEQAAGLAVLHQEGK